MAMRYLASIVPILLAGCTTAPTVGSNEPLERCETTSCFNQTQIRDFEVVDETTLIVYVGQQECPFLVELSGVFCDVTFLPGFDVVFEPTSQRAAREPGRGSGLGGTDIAYARVCADSLDMGIAQGPFTSGVDTDNFDGLSCRINNVESLTDDEIMEIYVDNRFAPPPPPFATGEISVEEPEPGESAPQSPDADAADTATE